MTTSEITFERDAINKLSHVSQFLCFQRVCKSVNEISYLLVRQCIFAADFGRYAQAFSALSITYGSMAREIIGYVEKIRQFSFACQVTSNEKIEVEVASFPKLLTILKSLLNSISFFEVKHGAVMTALALRQDAPLTSFQIPCEFTSSNAVLLLPLFQLGTTSLNHNGLNNDIDNILTMFSTPIKSLIAILSECTTNIACHFGAINAICTAADQHAIYPHSIQKVFKSQLSVFKLMSDNCLTFFVKVF